MQRERGVVFKALNPSNFSLFFAVTDKPFKNTFHHRKCFLDDRYIAVILHSRIIALPTGKIKAKRRV